MSSKIFMKIFILILALLAAANIYVGFHGQIDLLNIFVGGFMAGAMSIVISIGLIIMGGFDD